MLRSYIVTFAFVTFRYLIEFPPTMYLKPVQDLIITSIWACWTLPLFAADVVLKLTQIRRSAMIVPTNA